MAQALAESIQNWQSEEWPPKGPSGSPSFVLEGTVLRHYPLNVRRARVQQGYLKQAVTADVNQKYRALELQVDASKQETNGTAVPVSSLQSIFAPWIAAAAGPNAGATPAHVVARPGVLVAWCDAGVLSHLSAAKLEGKAVELTGARVRITTDGTSLIGRSVDVLLEPAQNKAAAAPSLESQPNLFAQAQNKFAPPAALAAKPTASSNKKDDDDWDD